MLAPIGTPTGDGRRIARGGFTHRPLPLALKWQRSDEGGHEKSTVVGSLERVDIDEDSGAVWGEGELFDDVSPTAMPRLAEDVAEAKLLLEKKVIGPSVDPGSVQAVTVIKGEEEPLTDERLNAYYMKHGALPETETLFTDYEIGAATLVTVPAFAEVRPFELFDDDGTPMPGREAIMAACAAPELPELDAALFADPELATYTSYTERDLGNGWVHVFGHVATHDVCHVGMRVCTTAPYSEQEYQPFHRYAATRGGHELPVMAGRLTSAFGKLENQCRCHPGNDDHACGNLSYGGAIAHHDRMETLAYVCAGEDEANNAIWYSGVRAPEISQRGVDLLNSRRVVSGDWREHGPGMELVEVLALAKRGPGFPLPTPRASMANGRQRSLTAAGVLSPERAELLTQASQVFTVKEGGPVLTDQAATGGIDYDRLGASVAQHLMAAASGREAEPVALTAAVRGGGWADMPVADGGRTWDKGAAVRRLVDWADGDISGKYARAFLWHDGDPDLQGSYKFPIADVVDGHLEIIPNAVRNALSRLSQSDVPASDQEHMRGILEGILERANGDDGGMTAAAPTSYSGAMVALRMTDADAARLAVTDGLPMDDLHLTLAYLGDADQIDEPTRERMAKGMGKIAKKLGGPLTADGFAVSAFNPGTANDRPTAIVMGVSGDMLADLQAGVCKAIGAMCSDDGYQMPGQHSPWVAHTTLTYDDDLSKIGAYADRVGPITFDRLRLAFAGENIDIPLGEIIAVDEDEQDERDKTEQYARTARANQLSASIWFAADADRQRRAAELRNRIENAALAAA
jgi:2'-5' RNA ligase